MLGLGLNYFQLTLRPEYIAHNQFQHHSETLPESQNANCRNNKNFAHEMIPISKIH